MAETVYLLCALTSVACAFLLFRQFRRTRLRLLLYSSICFLGLAINNSLLIVDMVLFPEMNLSMWRTLPAALGVLPLLCALVWQRT